MAFRGQTQQWVLDAFEVDLDEAVSDKFTWTLRHPMFIKRVGFIYTEATPATIASPGVVSFEINGVEKATYTAETSKAVGFTNYLTSAGKADLNLTVKPGDTIKFKHKTQQTAATAGKGLFVVWYELVPDGVV